MINSNSSSRAARRSAIHDTRRGTLSLSSAFAQFRRLLLLIHSHWGRLMRVIGLGIVVGLFGLAAPYLTKLLIDEVYPSQDIQLMHLLVGGILAMTAARAVTTGIQAYYALHVNAHLRNSLTQYFFNHLQHLPMRFFEQRQVGELMSRFSDISRAIASVQRVFEVVFVQGVYLLLVPPLLFYLQWKLALLALVVVPLTTGVVALSGRALRSIWKEASEAYAALSAQQVEVLSQMRTMKSMALEAMVFERTQGMVGNAMNLELRAGTLGQVVDTVNGLLNALSLALLTWVGWKLILQGQMSLGDYIAFTAYMTFLNGPVNKFVGFFSDFQRSAVNFDRMFEYLDELPEQDPETAYRPPAPIHHRLRGEIRLQEVGFGYEEGRPVLHSVSLEVPAGSVTAIVGPSGSGKTSLLRLLLRMEQPDSGQILIDGVPLGQLSLPDLRRQVSVVWQEYGMLHGTLWENLTLGNSDVSAAAVNRAIRIAQIEDFVASLPEGLNTPVAEWGMSMSGGQRQRLAIARALVRQAPILLLDEATANIDQQAEALIIQSLLRELDGATIMYVTHRIATAVHADQIFVLQHGQVAGVGKHSVLLETCAAYRDLYQPDAVRRPAAHPRAPAELMVSPVQ
jgi:ABC-type bacteriocin/lantibiotic exporter with double-glycine peptidase domain